jgi:hypothetical protein
LVVTTIGVGKFTVTVVVVSVPVSGTAVGGVVAVFR